MAWLRRIPPMPVIAVGVVAMLVGVSAFGAVALYDFQDGRPSGKLDVPTLAEAAGLALNADGILDTDRDGLADAIENFVYGTDPQNWSTTHSGIPDSWLIRYEFNPLDPSVANRTVPPPPVAELPDAYLNQWPDQFLATLAEAYSFGRPADWNESADGPYLGGLDPTEWDSNGDKIPDGWLLYYGVDPRQAGVGAQSLSGAEGLSVAEAFEHNTDPRSIDTDADGLSDRREIEGISNPNYPELGPPKLTSNPAFFSTAGTGVCDGYLAHHGLDPSDPASAYTDFALSGATTREKYNWSVAHVTGSVCSSKRGLDPFKQSTLDLPIPDGWLIRYELNPLDANAPDQATESTLDAGLVDLQPLADAPPLPHVNLTVFREYVHGRPQDWNEATDGPWWGGTDPGHADTDRDGLSDAQEIRAAYLQWSAKVGPGSIPIRHVVRSDPLLADGDVDGLSDEEELRTHLTDPSRQDTDLDGIPDAEEVSNTLGLNATRADSAEDSLLDGARLSLLQVRSDRYRADPSYEYAGKEARDILDWIGLLGGASGVTTAEAAAALLAPGADADGDGTPNILDQDIDGDGLDNGWEVDPSLFRQSRFGAGDVERQATDPLNPDTDGDKLLDGFEVLNGQPLTNMEPPRYTMDPSRWDSDEDDLSDGDEDPDGDTFEWWSFDETGFGTANTFLFPNEAEQSWNTKPNVFDSDGDGLGDGWKVFWGELYDQIPVGAKTPLRGEDQSDEFVSENSYNRFRLTLSLAGEAGDLVETFSGVGPPGTSRTVYQYRHEVRFRFLDVQAAKTNPYLADTSRDQIPDWWASLHRSLPAGTPVQEANCVSHDALSPLVHYRQTDDADDDGVNNKDEYLRGTHPFCGDTDLDGVSDYTESQLNLNGANPADGAIAFSGSDDLDQDGLPDFRELQQQLKPFTPDSDGDGLADHVNLPVTANGFAENDPWARVYVDLGLTYSTAAQAGSRRFFFLGETDLDTNPRVGDDSGTGAPAGWLLAHTGSTIPSSPDAGSAAQYVFGMPSWWDQPIHGPWWGGLGPFEDDIEAREENDLDQDGLLDFDGTDGYEDPMPAANKLNAWRPIDWSSYPSGLGIVAPDASARPWDPNLPPLVRRLLAQAYINPRSVDADAVHPVRGPAPAAAPTPCIDVLGVFDTNGVKVQTVVKGRSYFVRGAVYDDCQTKAIRYNHVTVETRFATSLRSYAFGAAFTDAMGTFSVPFNITSEQKVDIPAGRPLVLRGETQGRVQWMADPSLVPTGSGRFFTIRSYAAEAVSGVRTAVSSALTSQELSVRAGSVISITAPDSVVMGDVFEIEARLTDSGGSPLRDPLIVTWPGDSNPRPRTTPDEHGVARFTLHAPRDPTGALDLVVESAPQGAAASFVTAGRGTETILVQRQMQVAITDVALRADAGATIAIAGRVTIENVGVSGVDIVVTIDGPGQPFTAVTKQTGAFGAFSAQLPIPITQPRGSYTILATVLHTAASLQGQDSRVFEIRSKPVFTGVTASAMQQDTNVTVFGMLAEPDLRPISDAIVSVKLGPHVNETTTDSAGRFRVQFRSDFPVGSIQQSIEFEGDEEHLDATHVTDRAVLAATKLEMEPGKAARGGSAQVRARLADALGTPIIGAPVTMRWATARPQSVLTDGAGVATLQVPSDLTKNLGPVLVRASYAGTTDGALGASTTSATWIVVSAAELVLPTGVYVAGTPIPDGVLRDAGSKVALVGSDVTVKIGDNATHVPTNDIGGFPLMEATRIDTPPRNLTILARYAGNASYPATEQATTISIVARTRLNVSLPTVGVAGSLVTGTVRVTGLGGEPVSDGRVTVLLANETIASAPVVHGLARLSLAIPANAARGPAMLEIRFIGSATHGDAEASWAMRIQRALTLSLHALPVEPGQVSVIELLATDGGLPVPNATLFLAINGFAGGLSGKTGPDGIATFKIEQPPGDVHVAARFSAASDYVAAHALATVSPTEPTPLYVQVAKPTSWWALTAVLALALLVPLLYRLRRSPLEPLMRRMRRILAKRGPDAQQIYAAYALLEETAVGNGWLDALARPARLVQKAVEPHLPRVARPALGDLMTVFEFARYGSDQVTKDHRVAARNCLDKIVSALRRQALGTSAQPEAAPT